MNQLGQHSECRNESGKEFAYALGGDGFARGACAPFGEPLPDRWCCWLCGCVGAWDFELELGAAAAAAGEAESAAPNRWDAGDVLDVPAVLFVLAVKSVLYDCLSWGAGDGAIAIAVLIMSGVERIRSGSRFAVGAVGAVRRVFLARYSGVLVLPAKPARDCQAWVGTVPAPDAPLWSFCQENDWQEPALCASFSRSKRIRERSLRWTCSCSAG